MTVTGEDGTWAAGVTPASRLGRDLALDSLEWAALAALVAERSGGRADLLAFAASLTLDQLIGLTVGDLAGYLAAALADGGPHRSGA